MMLGDWSDREVHAAFGWGWHSTEGAPEEEQPLLAVLLFVGFTFVIVIVLLNLLIAILSETFERTTESMSRCARLYFRAAARCGFSDSLPRGIRWLTHFVSADIRAASHQLRGMLALILS